VRLGYYLSGTNLKKHSKQAAGKTTAGQFKRGRVNCSGNTQEQTAWRGIARRQHGVRIRFFPGSLPCASSARLRRTIPTEKTCFACGFLQIPPNNGHPCRPASSSPDRVCRGLPISEHLLGVRPAGRTKKKAAR
jgi:hypothetical protein